MDVDLFLVAQKVESGLHNHDTQPCLAWCHENRSKLKKLKVQLIKMDQNSFIFHPPTFNQSSLEFRVHLQNFIELVRAEKRMEAIRFSEVSLMHSV